MKIKKIGGDRWKTFWETEDGRTFKLQRYPTSRHAAWEQIALYQQVLKYTKVGEVVEIDGWARKVVERAIRGQAGQ